ncbi:MAG: hypothetical protein M3457_14150, partial [Chloroflexota bacterium]|nr:hypothetical protein [Chloroflexota bacterium]
MTTRSRTRTRLSIDRRTLVRGGAGLAAGAAFARAGLPASAQDAAGPITIPEPATTLPSDDVTFRWIDSGDVKGFYWRAFFEQYQVAHPNITVEYQGLP